MPLVYHVTAETVRQLSRIASLPGIRQKLDTVLRTARPVARESGPRQDVPVLELRLSDEERDAVEHDLCMALNHHGFEEGGEQTPCGHVYEGLLGLIRAPRWRLG